MGKDRNITITKEDGGWKVIKEEVSEEVVSSDEDMLVFLETKIEELKQFLEITELGEEDPVFDVSSNYQIQRIDRAIERLQADRAKLVEGLEEVEFPKKQTALSDLKFYKKELEALEGAIEDAKPPAEEELPAEE